MKMRQWQSLPVLRIIQGASDGECILKPVNDSINPEWIWRDHNSQETPMLLLVNVGAGPCFDINITWHIESVENWEERRQGSWSKDLIFATGPSSLVFIINNNSSDIFQCQLDHVDRRIGIKGNIMETLDLHIPESIANGMLRNELFAIALDRSNYNVPRSILVSVMGLDIYGKPHSISQRIVLQPFSLTRNVDGGQIRWDLAVSGAS